MQLIFKGNISRKAALAGEKRTVLKPANRAADELAARRHGLRISCAAARTALMMF
jgi:hypothetical protein